MDQTSMPSLEWLDDAVPVSTRFNDTYYARTEGLEETRHVFLRGNDLPARFCPDFRIAELGFGTGLNCLAAWKAWDDCGQDTPLEFTSFEAFPMRAEDMAKALAMWPELFDRATQLTRAWAKGQRRIELGSLRLRVIEGDARDKLRNWTGRADAWFLDGFAPARNPELWTPNILKEVARHTRPGGTFATYTAAGHVRRALAAVGFEVTRADGFNHKRHMTRGVWG